MLCIHFRDYNGPKILIFSQVFIRLWGRRGGGGRVGSGRVGRGSLGASFREPRGRRGLFFFFISREQESELPGALQNKKGHFFSPLFFL